MSFGAQLQKLQSRFNHSLAVASPESAFIHYMFRQIQEDCRPAQLGDPIAPPKLALGMAPELATVGFLSAVGVNGVRGLYPRWKDSFARLKNKDPFPVDRQAFTLRPIEFLGICLGAREIAGRSSDELEWLKQLLPEQRRQLQGRWSTWLAAAAGIALTGSDESREALLLEELQSDELALLLWLRTSQACSSNGFWRTIDIAALQEALLRKCAVSEDDVADPARAAILYASLKWCVLTSLRTAVEETWQLGQTRKDIVELITTIFRRFHRMAKQLEVRHDGRGTLLLKDEYDVQDLMHAALLLFFDDVREETWTPDYAGNSSRTDFLLRNESIVIETKMTRPRLGQKEVANQLIVDRARYATDPRCKTLMCFIYDPEGRCKNPTALENDLAQEETPHTRVVVFSGRQ